MCSTVTQIKNAAVRSENQGGTGDSANLTQTLSDLQCKSQSSENEPDLLK